MSAPKTPREADEAAFYECEGNTQACLKAAFDAYEAAAKTARDEIIRLLEEVGLALSEIKEG